MTLRPTDAGPLCRTGRRRPRPGTPDPRRVVLRSTDQQLAVTTSCQSEHDILMTFQQGRVEPVEVVDPDQVRVGGDRQRSLRDRRSRVVVGDGGGRGREGSREETRVDDLVVEANDLPRHGQGRERLSDNILIDVDSRDGAGCGSVAVYKGRSASLVAYRWARKGCVHDIQDLVHFAGYRC